MKYLLLFWCFLASTLTAFAQELYVNTEPASNMARNSLGVRLENQGNFNPGFRNRSTLELMYGASKNLMVHASGYLSDFYRQKQHLEGFSAYAKYRFLSVDSVQRHFRGAAFIKASTLNNPILNQEISLEGDNSGLQTGLIFTQLLHKVALSGSISYLRGLDNQNNQIPVGFAHDAVAYSLSSGYLLSPKNYTNYNQTNVNLYLELLGKTNPSYGQSYLDAAPAVQFIFNSVFRVDLSYRTHLYNSMTRNSANMYLVRLEYNFFNLF